MIVIDGTYTKLKETKETGRIGYKNTLPALPPHIRHDGACWNYYTKALKLFQTACKNLHDPVKQASTNSITIDGKSEESKTQKVDHAFVKQNGKNVLALTSESSRRFTQILQRS